jgi:hypothetical protein
MIDPRISGGKATSIISAVTSRYQANNGIRAIPMPGARSFSTVTTISIAAQIAEISTKVTPSSQTSALIPGVYAFDASGVYMNQPPSGAAPKASAAISIVPPNR